MYHLGEHHIGSGENPEIGLWVLFATSRDKNYPIFETGIVAGRIIEVDLKNKECKIESLPVGITYVKPFDDIYAASDCYNRKDVI
jgi:hypothetical protein